MATFKVGFHEEGSTFGLTFSDPQPMTVNFRGVKVVETGDYEKLSNKPSINDVMLIGNKTFEELGDRNLSNLEIKAIFDRIFDNGGN